MKKLSRRLRALQKPSRLLAEYRRLRAEFVLPGAEISRVERWRIFLERHPDPAEFERKYKRYERIRRRLPARLTTAA